MEVSFYTGTPLETGKTSIQGKVSPALLSIIKHFKENNKILDYGAGKYGRNAVYLREQGFKVYAYDPYNGKNKDGYKEVSNIYPTDKFDIVFTCYVLNVVTNDTENNILKNTKEAGKQVFHIVRNKDILETIEKALIRRDKTVYNFFIQYFADREISIKDFCMYGTQTSRGFQRLTFLENKGYFLIKETYGYKIYKQ